MITYKCKMCGGDLEIAEGVTIAECEYCGTKQTVPKAMDENMQNLFNRANALRIKSEFDKAEKLYEKIVQADSSQSEAYWGLILCKYGIEYVDDPITFKKIPTCHRASYDSIIADDDYKSALENADESQRVLYEEQAKEIDRIQKEILMLAQKEETYDVFICYKETDSEGKRTQDSVIANDIYYQLKNQGFKVFYAAITLEGKLGSAYEPIIFAALNSAKVMLSIGTKPEYFNAVWVKNEWSRFLKIIQKDRSKLLIPCYRDMDAYELPEEFAHLQAQNMGKIGFINDIVRGIEKVLKKDDPKATVGRETIVQGGNLTIVPLLKRVFIFLEDGDWKSADEYCEKVLDLAPECAEAYLGKLMAELNVRKQDDLKDCDKPFDDNANFQKTVRFGDESLKSILNGYIVFINTRNENARLEGLYQKACVLMDTAEVNSELTRAAFIFDEIINYKDSEEKKDICERRVKNSIYEEANMDLETLYMVPYEIEELKISISMFETIIDWKDSAQKIELFKKKIQEIENKIAKKAKIKKIIKISLLLTVILAIAGVIIANVVIIPMVEYDSAMSLMKAGKYTEAISVFESLDGYKDSVSKIDECNMAITVSKYNNAIALMDSGNIVEAYETFITLDGYKDSAEKADSIFDKYKIEKLKVAKVGDYVLWGAYEQDNKTSNGKEAIEWLVLEVKDGQALLISKSALDCKPYNSSRIGVTWETCTLRQWLNNDFLNAAFSADENKKILTAIVSADGNDEYVTSPGNATQDKVFLLSIAEVNKYFKTNRAKKCDPTYFASANGAYASGGSCWWWLRSPGSNQKYAACVGYSGDVSEFGNYVNDSDSAVRPALWIDLNA